MDKQYFLELLHKYLNDEATDEEQQFLVKYYDLFSAEPDVISLLSDEQKEKLKKDIHSSIWENIDEHINADKKIVPLKAWFLRIAAAAVIIGICGIGFLFLRNKPVIKPTALNAVHKQKPNLLVILPDGSRVIISYGSKLTYASSFDGLAKREVYLTGEAFFDIKHDNLKPFVVHTGKVETTVLGTAFDVKALPGDKTITVTVTRGKVKVSDHNRLLGIIIPNQQITFNKQKSISTQSSIDAKTYTIWTAQDNLYFEDLSFGEAAKVLEERFKVKILFTDQLIQSKHFTSTFDKSASLDQALKSICEFNDASYSYDKERTTITISSKSQTN
ncbi:FecR family protein [Mucilaginibacter sp. BT774]|uniref:FecR family protein n=1 Tax=Mucilaginibacter sp. BT774 TaxID=3062276 RepID=UPI002675FFBD|nr:FecR family protein [Mucilaginibacter sp. BT774]MDO3628837.1 FecR domain-containing protein [Mucilaginibacter sp. BT774]